LIFNILNYLLNIIKLCKVSPKRCNTDDNGNVKDIVFYIVSFEMLLYVLVNIAVCCLWDTISYQY